MFSTIKFLSSLIIALSLSSTSFAEIQKSAESVSINQKLSQLESSSGGRIGVYAINTANNTHLGYRATERFPMACTSKVMGVAAVLKKSMKDKSLLAQKITYTKSDLTNWAPITEKNLNTGMSVKALCAAAISYSDNTAMNLLLKQLGGVKGMNAFARTIHDDMFQQTHDWPGEAMSGGQHNSDDSSTPAAMANSLKRLAFTDVLAKPQRELLLTWLRANTTGNSRIRAGVPQGWLVGDKTGSGFYYGTTNDIAIIWPPKCAPIVMAVYYTSNNKEAPKRGDIVASATRIILDEFAQRDSCLES
ncbi:MULTISPECIES: class A beta-lactamase [Legionella]|uniref:beta-lactamase n=1 Tax=Legionella maceachernii TaxID=466 RepID=A0A0W0WCW3_9GAMM|nr:class A beta-lactamase [Legionella maceachernii]KTD30169.1 beta-lactamase [Legionella maceachernii]SJZ93028.1 beta-lactamase class A [Legionella maceachernii]SUP03472.1 Beta-lactamase Toho-1 precursor [Legionella maceachernii]